MARPKGSRSAGYEAKRAELVRRLRLRLVTPDSPRASLRELAEAAGVSLRTLRHYFPGRDDLVEAVLEAHRAAGDPHLRRVAEPSGPFAASVRDALAYTAHGFRIGRLGEIHSLGLAEGLRHRRLGPAYLREVLEPTVEAVAARLRAHMERGEMKPADPRRAALVLVSPVVLGFLHQLELGGAAPLPLDTERLLDEAAAAFVEAFAARP